MELPSARFRMGPLMPRPTRLWPKLSRPSLVSASAETLKSLLGPLEVMEMMPPVTSP